MMTRKLAEQGQNNVVVWGYILIINRILYQMIRSIIKHVLAMSEFTKKHI